MNEITPGSLLVSNQAVSLAITQLKFGQKAFHGYIQNSKPIYTHVVFTKGTAFLVTAKGSYESWVVLFGNQFFRVEKHELRMFNLVDL